MQSAFVADPHESGYSFRRKFDVGKGARVGKTRHVGEVVSRENSAVHTRAATVVFVRGRIEKHDCVVRRKDRAQHLFVTFAARVSDGHSRHRLRLSRQGRVKGRVVGFGRFVVGVRIVGDFVRAGGRLTAAVAADVQRVVHYVCSHRDGAQQDYRKPFGYRFLSLHFTPRRIVTSAKYAIFPFASQDMLRMGAPSMLFLTAG